MPKVTVAVNGATAFCGPSQVAVVSAQLRSSVRGGAPGAERQEGGASDISSHCSQEEEVGLEPWRVRLLFAADQISGFVAETHSYLAQQCDVPISDVGKGTNFLRGCI